jgi:hypothetical protein
VNALDDQGAAGTKNTMHFVEERQAEVRRHRLSADVANALALLGAHLPAPT